ncbi:hypothetical protein N9B94_00425 [Verrucomicrobia bacterium]|nr:hypothetical protein [Verrucomicrobiota bacterium]
MNFLRIRIFFSFLLLVGSVSVLGAEAPMSVSISDSPFALKLISRWVHVIVAIILVGGVFFQRMIVLPSITEVLDEETQKKLMASVIGRWRKVVHGGAFLIFLSGIYNYVAVTRHAHVGDGMYHMLVGLKILLGLVVILLASFLVGRTSVAGKMRANARKWTSIILFLGLTIVLIAGYMKLM